MANILSRVSSWLANHIGGHVAARGVLDVLGGVGEQVVKDVGKEIVGKVTRNDLLMGVIDARLALKPDNFDREMKKEGIRAFNRFYADLEGPLRDLFEILFYRDVRDAIQECIANKRRGVREEIKDPKSGKTVKIVYVTAAEEEQEMYQTYIALVGLSGSKEIELEMGRLSQPSPLSRAVAKIKKGMKRDRGPKKAGGLANFINELCDEIEEGRS